MVIKSYFQKGYYVQWHHFPGEMNYPSQQNKMWKKLISLYKKQNIAWGQKLSSTLFVEREWII